MATSVLTIRSIILDGETPGLNRIGVGTEGSFGSYVGASSPRRILVEGEDILTNRILIGDEGVRAIHYVMLDTPYDAVYGTYSLDGAAGWLVRRRRR